jgi:uncharacterized protein YdhG (YjbR/CyaY superfamily)
MCADCSQRRHGDCAKEVEEQILSKQGIDDYLTTLDAFQRETLSILRQTILAIVPEAEEGISYGIPAFWLRGKVIAGFAAYKHHLSYFPHSGSVLEVLKEDLTQYSWSRGTLQFPVGAPLPKVLVKKLIATRLEQISNLE